MEILKNSLGVPDCYWYGETWEHQYLAMEKIEGVTLNRWVTKYFPSSIKQYDYLQNIENIIKQLKKIVLFAHKKGIYHQDIHLHNILINKEQKISLIDWGEVRFNTHPVGFHQVAASGFRTWGNDLTPEEIDWYTVLQIAYFLFYPLILPSDLVYDFGEQTMIAG